MSKKNDPASGGSPAETQQEKVLGDSVSEVINTLLETGTAILEAPTREALAEMVDEIPADCKYAVGAVGRKADGTAYTLRVDIINT